MKNNMKKALRCAFSLVELMVTLVVVAILTAAMAPVITKKLKLKEITVASGGGAISFQECSEEMKNKGCAFCGNSEDECSLCSIPCESYEYVDTKPCECASCTLKDEQCIECNAKSCKKCGAGWGLVSSKCDKCDAGEYSSGETACVTCPENHICSGNDTTPIACAVDQWAEAGSTSCNPCTDILANCGKCNPRECLECRKGYKLKEKDGALVCILASGSQAFTTAGEHSFTVPEGVEEIYVTLVSGGGGGGGGKTESKTKDFTSAGTHTWTIPLAARGNNVKISSVGGGGGNGGIVGNVGWYTNGATAGSGGSGKAFKDLTFPMPNQETIKVIVGKAGASASCSGNYGSGSCSGYKVVQVSDDACSGCGNAGASGYGGGATYFEGYANNTYMAGGGNGGSANSKAKWACSCTTSASGQTGATGGGSTSNNIFTTANVGYSRGHAKESGAMRIYYEDWVNGGGGGGAGQIVPKTALSVTEGQVLTVTVGAGGGGGAVNTDGTAGAQSKIVRNGETLLITSGVGANGGATAGGGGAVGSVTNGYTSDAITMDGFTSASGGTNSTTTGGSGGRTTINGSQTHCAGASGGAVNTVGASATGYGGCGGGGGGAGKAGGDGAPGYVKISWGEG